MFNTVMKAANVCNKFVWEMFDNKNQTFPIQKNKI